MGVLNGTVVGISVSQFEGRLEENPRNLALELKEGKYQPGFIKRCFIPKAGGKELRLLS